MLYPIGSVLPYAGPASAEGKLFSLGLIPCDGRPLSKSDHRYAALYHAIGTSYGGTSADFYVPDYRGRFLRGTDLGAGRDPDAATRTAPRPELPEKGNAADKVGSLQTGGVAAHKHGYARHTGYHHVNYGSAIGPGVYKTDDTTGGTSTGTGDTETRPRNAYVHYVIVFRNDIVTSVDRSEEGEDGVCSGDPDCAPRKYTDVTQAMRDCFEANAKKHGDITWKGDNESGTFTYSSLFATVVTNYTYDPATEVFELQIMKKPGIASCNYIYGKYAGGLADCKESDVDGGC